jgi:NADH-quinone oxidoreductase subunit N
MLAYSSVAHAGYALIGFLCFGEAGGAEATVFYLIVYSCMTLASFGVVLAVSAGTPAQYADDSIESFSGLGFRHPFLGLVMTVAVLSLAGIPPLAGFMGKLYLFSAAVNSGFVGLAIIAALNSVVSLYYYLRVLVTMYFASEQGEHSGSGAAVDTASALTLEWAPRTALTLATLGTLLLGVFSYACYPAVSLAIRGLG